MAPSPLVVVTRYWAYAEMTHAQPSDEGWYWAISDHHWADTWRGVFPTEADARHAGMAFLADALPRLLADVLRPRMTEAWGVWPRGRSLLTARDADDPAS